MHNVQTPEGLVSCTLKNKVYLYIVVQRTLNIHKFIEERGKPKTKIITSNICLLVEKSKGEGQTSARGKRILQFLIIVSPVL